MSKEAKKKDGGRKWASEAHFLQPPYGTLYARALSQGMSQLPTCSTIYTLTQVNLTQCQSRSFMHHWTLTIFNVCMHLQKYLYKMTVILWTFAHCEYISNMNKYYKVLCRKHKMYIHNRQSLCSNKVHNISDLENLW